MRVTRSLVIAVLTVGTLALLTGFAIAQSGDSMPSSMQPPVVSGHVRSAPPVVPVVARTPDWARRSYGLLGAEPDGLALSPVRREARNVFGANVALARTAQTSAAGPVSIVPAAADLCVAARRLLSCVPAQIAMQQGAFVIEDCVEGSDGLVQIVGMAPDAIRAVRLSLATGAVIEVKVERNVFATVSSAPIAGIEWVGKGGQATAALPDVGSCRR